MTKSKGPASIEAINDDYRKLKLSAKMLAKKLMMKHTKDERLEIVIWLRCAAHEIQIADRRGIAMSSREPSAVPKSVRSPQRGMRARKPGVE